MKIDLHYSTVITQPKTNRFCSLLAYEQNQIMGKTYEISQENFNKNNLKNQFKLVFISIRFDFFSLTFNFKLIGINLFSVDF